jgi:hypothetical protein
MDIDNLHSALTDRVWEDFYRILLLLQDVSDENLAMAEKHYETRRAGTGDLRELWDARLFHLHWLLRHVPRDEFIIAHTPSPESNEVRMSAEMMQQLALKAENVDQFFALSQEAAYAYDRHIGERDNERHKHRDSAVPEEMNNNIQTTTTSSTPNPHKQERQQDDKL